MVFRKPKGRLADLIRVDNCVLRQVPACDYLVVDWVGRKHFVELKGKHAEEGLKQIGATIPEFLERGSEEEIWCFVICSRIVTAASPGMRSEEARIRKKWKRAKIIWRSKTYEHILKEA